jgi:hypothetical protein
MTSRLTPIREVKSSALAKTRRAEAERSRRTDPEAEACKTYTLRSGWFSGKTRKSAR